MTATYRLDGLTTTQGMKTPCVVATTAAITLSGLQTVDGVTLTAGQRVLVKNQADAETNGIYVADTSAWQRAKDFDGAYDVVSGTMVHVYSGGTMQGVWAVAVNDPIVIGTTALSFELADWMGFVTPYMFGAAGDGVTNDTDAVQAAIVASHGNALLFPGGAYLCGPLVIAASVEFLGYGGATIKYASGTNTYLIDVTGTSTLFKSRGITYDGNYSAHNGTTFTIRHVAVGTANAPAGLDLEGNTFVNGDYADVAFYSDNTFNTVEKLTLHRNDFLGGMDGTDTLDTHYVHVVSGVVLDISDNYFDLLAPPTQYGRAGVVSYVDGYTGVGSRGKISGNTFVNVGRSSDAGNGVLGAIDGYYGVTNLTIEDNTLIDSWGRGIQIKSDALNVAICGNTVNGLSALHGASSINAQIGVNRSVTTSAGGTWVISANTCINSGRDGIAVSCANSDLSANGSPLSISSNVIKSATNRGIYLGTAVLASVSANVIDGACSTAGIQVDSAVGTVSVDDNICSGLTGPDLLVSSPGAASVVDVADNKFLSATPYSFTGTDAGNVRPSNNRTVAASPINAYSPMVSSTTAQSDWTNLPANTTVIGSPTLAIGSYDIELEGTCTAGAAGGINLFLAGSSSSSYWRVLGQLWNGTTLVDSRQATGSGTPAGTGCSFTGICTNFKIKYSVTLTAAGVINLRGNQNASSGTTTSVYVGATMKITRVG